MYGNKKLIILLSILGVLVLGIVAYGFIFGYNMKNEQQYARERAEAAQYITDTGNWVEIENLQGSSLFGLVEDLYADAASPDGAVNSLPDSDGDGYPDLYEHRAGTNPQKAETFDASHAAEYMIECEQAALKLTGTPDIATAGVVVNQYNKSRNAAFGSKIYELLYPSDETAVFTAELSIQFKVPEGQEAGKAVINQIMPNGTLEPQETTVDEQNLVASCKLEHFSSYVVVFDELLDFKLNDIPAVVLSIDDSGSMYYYNGDEDCNNDPDLLRYDFCYDLITSSKKEANFAMNYFAGTVYDGFGFDTKQKDMLGFITKLKKQPEAEKNFTGTSLGSALEKSVNEVITVNNPSRFVLCLTDGESTEGYDKWDKAVQKCRDENVTLIVVGLGDKVNVERLSADAVSTGGFYLNVKDAGCIETISDSILAVIKNKGVQALNITDKDQNSFKVNSYLVADSGFDMTKHAVTYGDYPVVSLVDGFTTETGCQGAGIAELMREWYMGSIAKTMPAVNAASGELRERVLASGTGTTYILPFTDYDLSKLESTTDTDLSKISVPALEAVSDYYDIITDYVNAGVNMHVVGSCLYVNDDKIPQYITDNPDKFYKAVVELKEQKTYTDAKHKKLKFDRVCIYYPYLNYFLENNAVGDDYFVRVIYTLFTHQLSENSGVEYFATEGSRVAGVKDNAALLDSISRKLMRGDPCLITFDTTGSAEATRANHTVNAVALYRDCNDARVYYLKCYDTKIRGSYLYFRIDTTDPNAYIIGDMYRGTRAYCFGLQTIE